MALAQTVALLSPSIYTCVRNWRDIQRSVGPYRPMHGLDWGRYRKPHTWQSRRQRLSFAADPQLQSLNYPQETLTNRATHLCKRNGTLRPDLLQTCPSPYVISCRICSFGVNGCRHKYRRIPKIGESWNSTLSGWQAWLIPKYSPHPDMCYHLKLGSSATNGACINSKEPQTLGSVGTPYLWGEGVADHLNKPRPHVRYHVKFSSSATKGVCNT